jgi:hypothetical protein
VVDVDVFRIAMPFLDILLAAARGPKIAPFQSAQKGRLHMTTIKQVALVAAGILCVLVFPTGVMCAGAPTASSEAAYKAATDTDPHRALTEYQQKMRAQKIQAAASELSQTGSSTSTTATINSADGSAAQAAVVAGSSSISASASLTQNQNPQETSYWCGPATVKEALGQLGKSFSQALLAAELRTTTSGTGWSGGGTSPTGFPVPDVMNAHQSRNYYVPESVPSTPSDSDVSNYKAFLMRDIATVRAPVIGDAWTSASSEFHLVGHPPGRTIFHWFDIYGYRTSGGTTYTKYEDSVHNAVTVSWHDAVPAYSELPSHQIAHIVGGRGYVW